MPYFPNSIVPKNLARETEEEVDGSPLIYNARDYNRQLREVRAIECSLLGANGRFGLVSAVEAAETAVENLKRGNGVAILSGTIPSGTSVPIPDAVIFSRTVGQVLAADTQIKLSSTTGFPTSGIVTKFNALETKTFCTSGAVPGPGNQCAAGTQYPDYTYFLAGNKAMTLQEVIQYDGIANGTLLNCTRSIEGTTAQDATAAKPALVISGKASVVFSHNGYARPWTKPSQFYLTNDALLTVTGHLLEDGSSMAIKADISLIMEIGYSLVVIGGYESSLGSNSLLCR